MDAFFLSSIKHDLVNRFSQETFGETTNSIFRVCFIQNFNYISAFKYSEESHNLSMTLMSQWTDMLQYSRAKYITYNGCTL